MSNQSSEAAPEIIVEYEVLFSKRAGVTILIPEMTAFNCGLEVPVNFKISPENPRDIIINTGDKKIILKKLQKDYLDTAITYGFIMFYEIKDDEVIRCTPCNYKKN